MREVFAGFVTGYALSLLAAPIGAIALIRSNDRSGFAQRFAPRGTNVVALSVVLHLVAILVLTAVGMVLGLSLHGLEQRRPAGGLGSPNAIYTIAVIALTAVIFLPSMAVPMVRRVAVVSAMIFAASFGWATPWLAQLGK